MKAWRSAGTVFAMGVVAVLALCTSAARGQSVTQLATAPSFSPGSQDVFVTDFTGARSGTIPRGIQYLSGSLSIVTWNGRQVLRATESSEFLIPLSQQLPQDFTIEVDVVPKDCCPPPDLTIEGTASLNQGTGSAHLLLLADAEHGSAYVIGGATDNYELLLPEKLRPTLPGALTKVGVSVEGGTIRLFINGQPVYAHQAWFARGQVLRITLGGSTDDQGTVKPVYLARVRVATGGPTLVTAIAPIPSGTITPLSTAQPAQPSPPTLPSPTIALNGFTAAGGSSTIRAPTINLPGFVANGISPGIATRTVALAPIVAAGASPPPGALTLAPKTVALPALAASGGSSAPSPRSIALPGITAIGSSGGLRPLTVALPAFTASGSKTP